MKIDDVMKLIDAGFSKEEILNISNEAEQAPSGDPTPEAAPAAPEAPKPAPQPAPDAMKEVLEGFLNSFKTVVNDMKAANIGSSSIPDQHRDSAEEVLASIIAPPAKKK